MLSSITSINVSQYLPEVLLLAGAALLTFLFLFNLKARLARRPRDQSAADFIEEVRQEYGIERSDRPKSERFLEGRPPRGEIEFEQVARRLAAQIENKTIALETVVRQADERIRLLREVLDQAPGASISPAKISDRKAPTAGPVRASRSESRRDRTVASSTNGSARRAQPTSRTRNISDEPPVVRTRSVDPLSQNVYDLADRGRTPVEIAQHLDEQVGKVELILALRDV